MIYPIQGKNAVVSFDTGSGYEPFMCATTIQVAVEADTVPIRTPGDGAWKKSDYQAIGYKLTLSGIMVFTDFSIWELMLSQMALAPLSVQVSFTDDQTVPTIRSLRGSVTVKSTQIDAIVGEVTKGTIELEGSGILQGFTGLVPCDTVITGLTITGVEDPSGNVDVSYTFTGDLYQVMYQIDGAGAWIYALSGVALAIPGLSLGIHTIEVIPLCSNGYQGTGISQTFTVTQSLTCPTTISAITVNTTNLTATVTYSGTATQMMYAIDATVGQIVPINSVISFPGIGLGNHTIYVTPICTVGGMLVYGMQVQQNFTITAQPSQATLNYSFSNSTTLQGYQYQIFVNNVLVATGTPGTSGSINVAVGSIVRAACNAHGARIGGIYQDVTAGLSVVDNTTSTTLYSNTDHNIITSLSYTFTTVGHTYTITETFAP